MVWSDKTIIERMSERITPFLAQQVRIDETFKKVISYGTSCNGYDVRLARQFKAQSFFGKATIDPKFQDEKQWDDVFTFDPHKRFFELRPGECVLGATLEHIDMPDDVMALCIGKSTYARCGLLVNATPIEAGWRGHITLELSNVGQLPIRVYTEEGIAQLVFMPLDQRPKTTYADRGGKYQDQQDSPVTALI